MKDKIYCSNCKKQIITVKVYYAFGNWFCSTRCSFEFDNMNRVDRR